MGWFSNKLTVNRAGNTVGMAAVLMSFQESKNTLNAANEFVAGQKRRASGLSAQAFAVQGASSYTGRSLQQAINDLGNYERDGREVDEDLDQRMITMLRITEQFSMPRGQRQLNLSGTDMTVAMMGSASEVCANLAILKRDHMDKVSNAVTNIDNADRELNGSSSSRASNLLPSFG
jgi:hypothetical protein